MARNSKGSVNTLRRIARIVCRALICTGGLAVIATAANAQTTPLAYRSDADFYGPLDCEAGCYWDVFPVVIPAGVAGYQPTWSPDGAWLAFTDGYDIFVIPATGGNAVTLTNAIHTTSYSYFFAPAWSPDGGQIAFISRTGDDASEIDLINRDGSGVRALSNRAARDLNYIPWVNVDHPAWSPDGARIVFTCEIDLNNLDICVINRDGTGLVRLTNDPGADWSPVWSPDGTRIAFSTGRFGGGNVLALMNDDGSGVSQIGTSIQGVPGSWSPDGAQIAFTASGDPQSCGYSTAAATVAMSRLPFTRRRPMAQSSRDSSTTEVIRPGCPCQSRSPHSRSRAMGAPASLMRPAPGIPMGRSRAMPGTLVTERRGQARR